MPWEDAAARVRLKELAERGVRFQPLMLEIGYELVRSTLQRFEDEVDSNGHPWVDLKSATLARKRGSKKLVADGVLRGGIAVLKATDGFVEIGADREYAAVHQFGSATDMPFSSSLGLRGRIWALAPKDRRAVAKIISEFVNISS